MCYLNNVYYYYFNLCTVLARDLSKKDFNLEGLPGRINFNQKMK